jgi:hypothetical protein
MSKIKRRLSSPTRRRRKKSSSPHFKTKKRRSRVTKSVRKTLFKSPYEGRKCQIDLVKRAIFMAGSQAKAQGVLDWNTKPQKMANEIELFLNNISSQSGGKTPTQKEFDKMKTELEKLKSVKGQYSKKDLGEECTWDQMVLSLLIICLMAWGGWGTITWACAKENQNLDNIVSNIQGVASRRISGLFDAASASADLNDASVFKEAWNLLYEALSNFFYFKGVDVEIARMTGQNPAESSMKKAILILARRICGMLPKTSFSYPFIWVGAIGSWLANRMSWKKKAPPIADILGQLQHLDQADLADTLKRMEQDPSIQDAIKMINKEKAKLNAVPAVQIKGSPNRKKLFGTKKSHSSSSAKVSSGSQKKKKSQSLPKISVSKKSKKGSRKTKSVSPAVSA